MTRCSRRLAIPLPRSNLPVIACCPAKKPYQDEEPPQQDKQEGVVQPHPGIQRTVSKPEDATYM